MTLSDGHLYGSGDEGTRRDRGPAPQGGGGGGGVGDTTRRSEAEGDPARVRHVHCPEVSFLGLAVTVLAPSIAYPSATPRAPAHHAQLLRHSIPCASAHLGLEAIHDHGGSYALQCEHNHGYV